MGKKYHVKNGNRTQYQCEYNINGKLFSKKGLIKHFMIKHVKSRKKKHYCKKCKVMFNYIEDLTEHITLTHAGDTQKVVTIDEFRCQLCPKTFCHLKGLQSHTKKKHGNMNAVVGTEICPGSILKNIQMQDEEMPLWESQAIRNGEAELSEAVPNGLHKPQKEMFLINSQDIKNEEKLSGNILNELQSVPVEMCQQDIRNEHQICHEQSVERGQQNSHAKSYPLAKTPFECEICHLLCDTYIQWDKHSASHRGTVWHECEICHEVFSRKVSLDEHQLTHTVKNLKQCNICHSYFSLRNGLKESHGIVNAEPLDQCETKSLMCNICEKLFSNEMYLDRHMVVTHTGQKPHDCEICQAAFCIESHLVRLLTFLSENTQHEQGTFLEVQYNSMKTSFYKILLSHVEKNLHENEGCNVASNLQIPRAKLEDTINIE